jgi:hypothetical protein
MRFDISEQSAAGEIDGRRAKRSSGLLLTRLAEAGGLLSYGASIGDMYPNAESYIGRTQASGARRVPAAPADQVRSCGHSGDRSGTRPRDRAYAPRPD